MAGVSGRAGTFHRSDTRVSNVVQFPSDLEMEILFSNLWYPTRLARGTGVLRAAWRCCRAQMQFRAVAFCQRSKCHAPAEVILYRNQLITDALFTARARSFSLSIFVRFAKRYAGARESWLVTWIRIAFLFVWSLTDARSARNNVRACVSISCLMFHWCFTAGCVSPFQGNSDGNFD